jgi:hypothetical protein
MRVAEVLETSTYQTGFLFLSQTGGSASGVVVAGR